MPAQTTPRVTKPSDLWKAFELPPTWLKNFPSKQARYSEPHQSLPNCKYSILVKTIERVVLFLAEMLLPNAHTKLVNDVTDRLSKSKSRESNTGGRTQQNTTAVCLELLKTAPLRSLERRVVLSIVCTAIPPREWTKKGVKISGQFRQRAAGDYATLSKGRVLHVPQYRRYKI